MFNDVPSSIPSERGVFEIKQENKFLREIKGYQEQILQLKDQLKDCTE